MKKFMIILITLFAFSTPLQASNLKRCNKLVEDLFYYALAGAPYELMKQNVDLYRDYLVNEDYMLQVALDQIYITIAWAKLDGNEPSYETLSNAQDLVCNLNFPAGLWR